VADLLQNTGSAVELQMKGGATARLTAIESRSVLSLIIMSSDDVPVLALCFYFKAVNRSHDPSN
jgi:hypothetical protein